MEEARIIFEDTNVSYIGAVEKKQTPYAPKKSKIRPSAIHSRNGLRPETEPCILDKTDRRYTHVDTPLLAGCKKHGQLTRDFKTSAVKRASGALWDGWISKMKPIPLKPLKLTPVQAICGFVDLEHYEPMVLNTSAGFPYVTTGKKVKSDYIRVTRDRDERPCDPVIGEEVYKEMERKAALRKKGIQQITPFIDTLKDERKKGEKVRKYGGTRVFCNPPVDYVIRMRQHFMHYTAAFMQQRMSLMHSVGINVQGTEWTQLANKLIDKGFNNICTIDYSNFGPSFNAQVAKEAAELMIRWTLQNVEGCDEAELRVLLHECLNSVHLCHNNLYQQKAGTPSGAPITVIINTLVNQIYVL